MVWVMPRVSVNGLGRPRVRDPVRWLGKVQSVMVSGFWTKIGFWFPVSGFWVRVNGLGCLGLGIGALVRESASGAGHRFG